MDEESFNVQLGSLKISDCEVCASNQAKYTCPRCELRTCSLECVKIHKKELECSGLRDKVKFKVLKKMDNFDLLSDYRLLEETSRVVNKPVRLPSISCANPVTGALPKDLFRFKCATSKRGVQILFLPPIFTRHVTNTSYLDHETQDLYWRIDWVFSQADNTLMTDERVLDTTILSSCVYKYIDSEERSPPLLSFYQAVGPSGIKLLLKAEKSAPNRYHLLDPTLSLRENLKGKLILEYPTIHVILSEHIYMFNIFSEEEEIGLQKRQRKRQHNYKRNHSGFKKRPFFRNNSEESSGGPREDENFAKDSSRPFIKENNHRQERHRPYFKNRPNYGRNDLPKISNDRIPRLNGPCSEIDY